MDTQTLQATPRVRAAGAPARHHPPARGVLAFWARLALFWAPVLLVLGTLEGVLWRTGETWPLERVVAEQRQRPATLFTRGYVGQDFYRYKWLGMEAARPRVLALGSSRVMKFRAAMFGADSAGFFNAGGMIQNVDDLAAFARRAEGLPAPRLVILGVDQWWLNAEWTSEGAREGFTAGVESDAALTWQAHLGAMRELVRRPGTLRSAAAVAVQGRGDAAGLAAVLRGKGFHADGSQTNGFATPRTAAEWAYRDRAHPSIPEQIRTGAGRFGRGWAGTLSAERLARLDTTLARLAARGTVVVGFAPPVSAEAAALVGGDARSRAIWGEGQARVAEVFRRHGFTYVDASTSARLGLDDRHLYDGIHGEETFAVHVLARMLADARVAAVVPGAAPAVRAMLASPRTNPWYPDYAAARGAR